jgi:hypothetical protein
MSSLGILMRTTVHLSPFDRPRGVVNERDVYESRGTVTVASNRRSSRCQPILPLSVEEPIMHGQRLLSTIKALKTGRMFFFSPCLVLTT